MIHEYETIVREFILNSQIPIIILHENHHLYHTDLEPQLDACRPSQKKSFFKRAKCLSNSAFRSDREASTALASLKKMGVVKVGMVGNTPKNILQGIFQGYCKVISIGGVGSGGLRNRHFSTIPGDKITSTVLCFFKLAPLWMGYHLHGMMGFMEMMAQPTSSSPRNTT